VDPFALWLLEGAVIPDAYERVVNRLSLRSAEDQLAKGVREDVGGYPKRVFRRWYRTQETWDAFVRGGQQSFDSLVDRLVAISADRFFGSQLSRDRAEATHRRSRRSSPS
jgi:hypothetical protein